MNSESPSTISTPETKNCIICYICNEKIPRENFSLHYEDCKSDYIISEKSKYYPLKEPLNINEIIEKISNSNLNDPNMINDINHQFIDLHKKMKNNFINEYNKSITPNEVSHYQKEECNYRKYSMDECKTENTHIYKKMFLSKRIRRASLNLKKITEEELKNTRKFSMN